MCLWNLGMQMADVHAGASGEDGRQHDENRMRDTHEEQSVGREAHLGALS